MVDVAIAGGGPSGIATALEIKRLAPELDVVILERNDAIGRKLRATGNGRCNIANTGYESYAEVSEFLARSGVAFRVYGNGLVYPYSESAADVTDQLEAELKACGIKIRTGCEVKTAEALGGACSTDGAADGAAGRIADGAAGFIVNGKLKCRYLVLALGGKAGPAFGCLGDGYKLARSFGHSVVTPVPILTPVEVKDFSKSGLSGIRAKGSAILLKDGTEVFREDGEIQFTKFGLSGICIFNMTRHMRYDRGEGLSKFTIMLDLDPECVINEYISGRLANSPEGVSRLVAGDLLRTVLRPALAAEVLNQAGVPSDVPAAKLSDADIAAIVKATHELEFKPDNIRGWKDAQCTMGGVSLDEIDEASSESKLTPGLYITGELLDYDGPCGGYNLCNAWYTGMKAGRSIADDALQN